MVLHRFFPNAKRRSGARAQRVILRNLDNIRVNRYYLRKKKYRPQTKFQSAPGEIDNIIDWRYTKKDLARNKIIAKHRDMAWAGIKPAILRMRPYLSKKKRIFLVNNAFKPI